MVSLKLLWNPEFYEGIILKMFLLRSSNFIIHLIHSWILMVLIIWGSVLWTHRTLSEFGVSRYLSPVSPVTLHQRNHFEYEHHFNIQNGRGGRTCASLYPCPCLLGSREKDCFSTLTFGHDILPMQWSWISCGGNFSPVLLGIFSHQLIQLWCVERSPQNHTILSGVTFVLFPSHQSEGFSQWSCFPLVRTD